MNLSTPQPAGPVVGFLNPNAPARFAAMHGPDPVARQWRPLASRKIGGDHERHEHENDDHGKTRAIMVYLSRLQSSIKT